MEVKKELKIIQNWAKSCKTLSQLLNVLKFYDKKLLKYKKCKNIVKNSYDFGYTMAIISTKTKQILNTQKINSK